MRGNAKFSSGENCSSSSARPCQRDLPRMRPAQKDEEICERSAYEVRVHALHRTIYVSRRRSRTIARTDKRRFCPNQVLGAAAHLRGRFGFGDCGEGGESVAATQPDGVDAPGADILHRSEE